MNTSVDYEKLFELFREKHKNIRIEGFTIADKKNINQNKFLVKLMELGVSLHIYDCDTQPSFTAEISTAVALSEEKEVMVVSNDPSLIRVFDMLEAKGKNPSLCFFSEKLEGSWMPTIIRGGANFFDLSNPKVKQRIVG